MLPLKALQEAVASWRKTKHPRFAAVAQWATARALAAAPPREVVGKGWKKSDIAGWLALYEEGDLLDLPRLFAAVGGGKSAPDIERLVLLSKLDDPRVTDGVLGLLENPPYRARTAFPFFRACMKALEGQGDLRVRPALEALASRYKSILETSVGDDVTALLRRTAESLDQVKPGPLPAAQEKKCAALEALFEVEQTQSKRGASTQRSAQANDEALLAAVYAAPGDDTPRLVFADALTERGDPRGEFIALQLARARGQATPAQLARERELSFDAKKRVAWGLPLTQGGGCHLARGFPDEFIAEPRMFKTVVGLSAVRTLHKVSGLERQISVKQARTFLLHEGAAGLVQVEGITRELFDGIDGPLPWRKLGLQFLPMKEEFNRMPQARELAFSSFQQALTAQSFDGLERIERLSIGRVEGPTLAPLLGLVELRISGFMPAFEWGQGAGPAGEVEAPGHREWDPRPRSWREWASSPSPASSRRSSTPTP